MSRSSSPRHALFTWFLFAAVVCGCEAPTTRNPLTDPPENPPGGSHPPGVISNLVQGFADGINQGAVDGWALDQSDSAASIQVALFVDGSATGTVTADRPRQDVNDALGV